MDVFRFSNPAGGTTMVGGSFISPVDSITWIERYLDAGDFTIKAKLDSGIKEQLPVGSYISHVDTREIMIVEAHAIDDNPGEPSVITITGRSFETILETRIVGSNLPWPESTPPTDYTLYAQYVWNQVETLIKNHILEENLIDPNDSIESVQVDTAIIDLLTTDVIETRKLKPGDLYKAVVELLAKGKLGIKSIRPGPNNVFAPTGLNTALYIHRGVDRSNSVVFSYADTEINSANYLWSNRNLKNCAMVSSKWFTTFVGTTKERSERRMMHVDASSVDSEFDEAPTGGAKADIIAAMQKLGTEAIANSNNLALVQADVSRDINTYTYRWHYDVGDTVMVHGNYDQAAPMRITEYVEILDENGRFGYPTLTKIEKETDD